MVVTVAVLVLGLVLLLGGGHFLVIGASNLARGLGVSALVVGLTVVSFGTSAPELGVNLTAAIEGRSELSFGNVIGSNLANIGLILGVAALVRPLKVQSHVIAREIPLMILATAVVTVMALDPELRGAQAVFDRSDGVVLLLLFTVFLYAAARTVLRARKADPLLAQSEEHPLRGRQSSLVSATFFVLAGLLCLAVGGHLTVTSAVSLAEALGIPSAVIGLSVVAIGTSLPELVTSVLAAQRGETDLAVGNVIGSNLFNLLVILGVTATVRPIPLPPRGAVDLVLLLGLSLVLVPLAITDRHSIVRGEGALLLLAWLGYTVWRLVSA